MDEFDRRFARVLSRYRSLAREPAPVGLPEEVLAAIAEIENFPCNQSGQDKSWLVRCEEADRRSVANRKLESEE